MWQMLCVTCHISHVMCHLARVRCHLFPVTYHLSLTTTATASDPPNPLIPKSPYPKTSNPLIPASPKSPYPQTSKPKVPQFPNPLILYYIRPPPPPTQQKGEPIFSSDELVKLIHWQRFCSSSKMPHNLV